MSADFCFSVATRIGKGAGSGIAPAAGHRIASAVPAHAGRWLLVGLMCWSLTASAIAAEDIIALEQLAIQQAVAAADPSVVRIETVGGVDLVGDLLTATGPTTGVIIRADGYILTSQFNFVSRPSSILVTLSDGRRFAAQLVASDNSRMLTLLKIDAGDLTPIEAVPAAEIRVGQRAIALGRVFDEKFPNLSVGIVSALQRISGRALQTDAKTSPINYGGPLIDLTGRCLGIVVPLSPQESGETAGVEWYDSGIGFAVPLSDMEPVLARLLAGETLFRGLLGVSFEDQGAISGAAKVIRVFPDSPADKAGLKVDDVIVAVNGQPVRKLNDLKQVVGRKYAKDEITLRVQRGDQNVEAVLTLAAEIQPYQFPYLGLLAERMTGAEQGPVAIRAVLADSPAEKAGIQAGDRIQKVGKEEVRTRQELAALIRRQRPETPVSLTIQRGGEAREVDATLGTLSELLPEEFERQLLRRPDQEVTAAVGRLNERLPNDGLSFWAYVPENYRDDREWGVLVWLHPAGDTLEAETLRAWTDICRDRGLILVGPRSGDIGGWTPDQEDAVKGVVEWLGERYRLDPARLIVMGREDSGIFASRLAFKYRDLVRGLIVIQAPLRSLPPDNAPEFPLQVVFASAVDSPQREIIDQSANVLRERKFPTLQLPWSAPDNNGFPSETVDRLAVWLDLLDRI
ncbi:PDZ domain-containing protein [Planctomicrobium sp. SH664]|uniref:PDZ domain-containing protein n=1 Tax=Planctomicrobium sp. SH664 TaxID=3448125 RepID=UPI003F5BEF10